MKKFGKKLAAILCMCAVLGTSYGTICYAAEGSIKATITSSRISGTYTYGKPGQQLRIDIFGFERDSAGREEVVSAVAYANGDYISVSATKAVTSSFKFYSMSAFGYVNGRPGASVYDVTP